MTSYSSSSDLVQFNLPHMPLLSIYANHPAYFLGRNINNA